MLKLVKGFLAIVGATLCAIGFVQSLRKEFGHGIKD